MALRPKHRREIRDLLRVLYDDKSWQPVHTDQLIDIVRSVRSDVAEEIESTAARDAATARKLQAKLREDVRDVERFRSMLKDQHLKIANLLDALIDLPLIKASTRDEDGNWVLDPTLIDNGDAKIALSAVEKVLRATGANAPEKLEVSGSTGSAFELLDAITVEVESE